MSIFDTVIPTEVKIIVSLIALLTSFIIGVKVTSSHYKDKENKAIIETQKKELVLNTTITGLRLDNLTKTNTIYLRGKNIEIKVPEYISDGKCVLTRGFVVQHNAAIDNEVLPDATSDLKETSSVTLTNAAKIIDENYTICNDYRNTIISLQGVLRAIQFAQKEQQ